MSWWLHKFFLKNWLLFLAIEELKGPCCGPMGDFHCHSCSPSVLTKVQLSDCCSKYTECPYRHLPQLSSAVLFLGYDPTWTYSRAENQKKLSMAILVYKYFSSKFVKRDQSNKNVYTGCSLFNSWPTFSPYIYNRVWSELTRRNSLSHSRLACSRYELS